MKKEIRSIHLLELKHTHTKCVLVCKYNMLVTPHGTFKFFVLTHSLSCALFFFPLSFSILVSEPVRDDTANIKTVCSAKKVGGPLLYTIECLQLCGSSFEKPPSWVNMTMPHTDESTHKQFSQFGVEELDWPAPLRWTGTPTASQTLSPNISVGPHWCSCGWMGETPCSQELVENLPRTVAAVWAAHSGCNIAGGCGSGRRAGRPLITGLAVRALAPVHKQEPQVAPDGALSVTIRMQSIYH